MELEGALAVALPKREDAAHQADAARPSVEHLRTAAREARAAHGDAGWSWLPTLSLSGGFRVVQATETRYGYVAGIAVELPILSRGQELRAEAEAGVRLADSRVRASERALRIDRARALVELDQTSRELERFEAATKPRVERLLRASESGYREGHRSIVELVDAERARTTVELRYLELQLAARRAEIALRARRGEFE
jgi:outer membrane protein TolC